MTPPPPVRPEKRGGAFGRDARLLLAAIVTGLVAGIVIAFFRRFIERSGDVIAATASGPHAWLLLAVPGLAGLLVAFLTIRFFPLSRSSGVNQTKAAFHVRGGDLPLIPAAGKFVIAALAIGSGQSLGPEDPALHLGAGLGAAVGRLFRLDSEHYRLMAPVGAAAGLAAAFGAPVSAVLFVIEEVTGRWSAASLGALMLASAGGMVATDALIGPAPLLRLDAPLTLGPAALLTYAAIGLLGALAAFLFARLLGHLRGLLQRLPARSRYVQPALAGLIIGAIGFFGAPQVMGAGYGVIDRVAQGHFLWEFLGLLTLLKILATSLSVSTGTPGGIFAPTLVVGALLGTAVVGAATALDPNLAIAGGTAALIGMSALFAGFLRAPITAVFMVVEVSGDYAIAVPAMIAAVIAYLLSRRIQPEPVFELLARQDGLVLPSMEAEREEVGSLPRA